MFVRANSLLPGSYSDTVTSISVQVEPKLLDPGDSEAQRPPEYEQNGFSSSANVLKEHSFPLSLSYQPLEEIHSYFGDEVGLYFSWLGTYTRALFAMSVLGNIVLASQLVGSGITDNPLTLAYSVYTGLWSISFIEAWRRRENELRFLWGTEELSRIEQPRPDFKGQLVISGETGSQQLEQISIAAYYTKQFVSIIVCVIFCVFTIVCALAAQMVRHCLLRRLGSPTFCTNTTR
eukprot:SAG22_NODE_815_length_7037_cov_6.192130_4_plen_234_part_00